MSAIFKHELHNYFHSLTAYVFGAFLLAFVGIGAMYYNIQAAVSNFEYVLSFGSLVFVVIVPILTMRVIAEEKKQKTDQLLYSLPITTVQVILGKYLALLVLYVLLGLLIRHLTGNGNLAYVERADQLSIQGEDSLQITWQEESSSYREEDHYFVTVDGEAQPLDTGLVEDFLYTLSALNLTEYMTYNAGEDDLATYGLDDPERTITLDYTTQDEDGSETAHTVSLAVSRAPAERWDDTQTDAGTETGGEEEVTAYARVDDSPIVYKITTQEYRALMDASYDTLRHKEILPVDLEQVSQVDVTLDGASYTVTASGEGEERTWSYGEQVLETSALPDALQALTADSFIGEGPTGQEEISFTLHLSLEGEPTVSIQFYRYDGACCLAVVDGQPTALVPRSQVVDLQEAVYAVVLGES